VAVTLYVSHHIAGPLYAIRRYLESISRGELDFQPKLRTDDQTSALTESLAHALETLNSRLISIRGGADALREASAKLPRHLQSADATTAECRRDLEDLLAREDALIRELQFFRLRTPPQKP
jgi:methyl-accepting chemotaxis protein